MPADLGYRPQQSAHRASCLVVAPARADRWQVWCLRRDPMLTIACQGGRGQRVTVRRPPEPRARASSEDRYGRRHPRGSQAASAVGCTGTPPRPGEHEGSPPRPRCVAGGPAAGLGLPDQRAGPHGRHRARRWPGLRRPWGGRRRTPGDYRRNGAHRIDRHVDFATRFQRSPGRDRVPGGQKLILSRIVRFSTGRIPGWRDSVSPTPAPCRLRWRLRAGARPG